MENSTSNSYTAFTGGSTPNISNGYNETVFDDTKQKPDREDSPKPEDTAGSFWQRKWRTLGQELPVSGLRYATGTEEPELRRVVWAVLILSGLGFMLYQVVQSFIEYYERPVDVAISYKFLSSMEFPAVTICNENRFNRDQIKILGIEEEIVMLYPPWQDAQWQPYINVTQVQNALDRMNASFHSVNAFYHNITTPSTSTIFQCFWEGNPCNSSNIAIRHTRMGECITFNFDGSLEAHRGGSAYGLGLIGDAQQGAYIAQEDFSAGFRVVAHEYYDDPLVESKGLRISTGTVSQIQLERVERKFLKSPYGTCTDSKVLPAFGKYTLTNCMAECIIDYQFSVCGCYQLNGLNDSTLTPVCDLLQERQCMRPAYYAYATSSSASSCSCPSSCDEIVYNMAISSSKLSNYLIEYLSLNVSQGTITEQRIKDDFVGIVLFYPTISYTLLEESIGYTTTTLFNDLGGALGLMLGSTFLTVYEVIDFIIWAGWEKHKLNRKVGNRSKTPSSAVKISL